jgi:hypothetical protein
MNAAVESCVVHMCTSVSEKRINSIFMFEYQPNNDPAHNRRLRRTPPVEARDNPSETFHPRLQGLFSLPPNSTWRLVFFFFIPEDGNDVFLGNIDVFPKYTVKNIAFILGASNFLPVLRFQS